MKLSDMSSKDVINDEDGARLGRISDVEIDVATGKILSVHIFRNLRIFNFFNSKDMLQIPWNKIIKIGNDVIIVENSERIKNDT